MKITNIIMSAAAVCVVALAASCSSKLGTLSADNFKVTPNPLEAVGGKVPATINGTFPEKYMAKKAVVVVTPELRYGDGKVAKGQSARFQGEKVLGNDQAIPYRVGGNYTMKTTFDYVPEMHSSEMWLTFDAYVGKKHVDVPALKVANGVVATSELYRATAASSNGCIAPDAFQRVTEQKQEANIKFLIQQANLRKSELKNNSVSEFVKLLKKISADQEGLNLAGVEVSAYASPDGGVKLNDKLAAQRQKATEGYVAGQMKSAKVKAPVDAKYTAQDWDGFKELVAASNLQDKDVIIRVLSMYSDPEEREAQIKNLSSAFRELADGILPQLRRARMTINYEVVGRDDAQIEKQLNEDASKLSVEEMLYAATLTNDAAKKEAIYKKTTQVYPNDYRAYNNLAALALAKGDDNAVRSYAAKAQQVKANCPEASANLALLALKDGDVAKAENFAAKAAGAAGANEALGNLHIAQGKYAQAQQDFGNTASNAAVLAQILNKDYAAATNTLKNIKAQDATTLYLTAVLNARQGNTAAAAEALAKAKSMNPAYNSFAADDIELKAIK